MQDQAATAEWKAKHGEIGVFPTTVVFLVSDAATPLAKADAIVADVQTRAADLRELLARHVTQARQVVRMLLEGRLVCQPFEDAREYGYTFTATGTYRRLGVSLAHSVNVGGGPNGTRSNLQNSSARFHCVVT